MIDERTIDRTEDLGGCLGLVVFDHQPATTPGRVRPFVWAFLLLRGAVRSEEVVGALAGHVADDDRRIWDDPLDRTQLQVVVQDTLAEMVAHQILRVNDSGLYVLRPEQIGKATSLVCSLNAQLPDHLLIEANGQV